MRRWAHPLLLVSAVSCAEGEVLAPLGEVLVTVDTDAPVPLLVSELRIDVYSADGTWIDSNKRLVRRRESWPGSFSIFIDEDADERVALVRLRAYSRTRDYRGERFLARPEGGDPAAIIETPAGDDTPRLVIDGEDRTPTSEPLPELSIDRLVRIRVRQALRATAHVTLHLACVGTMVDLAQQTSCIDTENQRVPLDDHPLEEGIVIPIESIGEGPLSQPRACNGTPRPGSGPPWYDGERCIAGGMYVHGSDAIFAGTEASEAVLVNASNFVTQLNSFPERVAVIAPFFMDEHEVTVGRFRRALIEGLSGLENELQANNGPLATTAGPDQIPECTWSALPLNREHYPLNCITWRGARAFCNFYGGDLPTEAQWEYAASRDGSAIKAPYPWGSETPTCEHAIYARARPFNGLDKCLHLGFGVQPTEANVNDVSGDGIVGLAGNLSEWSLDSYRSYASACWRAQPLADPKCWEEAPEVRAKRGSSWGTNNVGTAPYRWGKQASYVVSLVGFRCVREAL
jgi:formylglycine-generating enzyme required for sulfatase activity